MYHKNKATADALAKEIEEDDRVQWVAVQFEPYNGFVVRVQPKFLDISDLAEKAEILDGIKRDRPKKAPPRIEEAPKGTKAPGKVSKGLKPNERAAAKHPSGVFTYTRAKNHRKEGTGGAKAIDWLIANPGSTAAEIAAAGNFMQHIDWDLNKTSYIRKDG